MHGRDGDGANVPGQMEWADPALGLPLRHPTDVAVPKGLDRDNARKLVEEVNLPPKPDRPRRTDLPT
jgi:hypothetical protein